MAYRNRTNKIKVNLVDSNTRKKIDLSSIAEITYTLLTDTPLVKTLTGGGVQIVNNDHALVTISKNECDFTGYFVHEIKIQNQLGEEFGVELSDKNINFIDTRT